MNRMVFLPTIIGRPEHWFLKNIDVILDLKSEPLIFKFGFYSFIDQIYNKKPFPVIVEMIKELSFHHSDFDTFVFTGWEVLEAAEQLYERFPEAEFFIPSNRYIPENLKEWYEFQKTGPDQPLFPKGQEHEELIKIANRQVEKIDLFLKDKEYKKIGNNFQHIGNYPLFHIDKRTSK